MPRLNISIKLILISTLLLSVVIGVFAKYLSYRLKRGEPFSKKIPRRGSRRWPR